MRMVRVPWRAGRREACGRERRSHSSGTPMERGLGSPASIVTMAIVGPARAVIVASPCVTAITVVAVAFAAVVPTLAAAPATPGSSKLVSGAEAAGGAERGAGKPGWVCVDTYPLAPSQYAPGGSQALTLSSIPPPSNFLSSDPGCARFASTRAWHQTCRKAGLVAVRGARATVNAGDGCEW